MTVTPLEFAHTLRSMRPDYATTVRHVEGRIEGLRHKAERLAKYKGLEANVRGVVAAAARYEEALKVLVDEKDTFQ